MQTVVFFPANRTKQDEKNKLLALHLRVGDGAETTRHFFSNSDPGMLQASGGGSDGRCVPK